MEKVRTLVIGAGISGLATAAALAERYFAGRPDGLRPPNNSEELLVARTPSRG